MQMCILRGERRAQTTRDQARVRGQCAIAPPSHHFVVYTVEIISVYFVRYILPTSLAEP